MALDSGVVVVTEALSDDVLDAESVLVLTLEVVLDPASLLFNSFMTD